jgi:hypothetical protein
MKANALKKLIKEAVKEAIQEELKEVLLETPTIDVAASIPSTPSLSLAEQKKKYMDVIGETALSFTSKDAQGFGNKPFNPKGTIDTTSPNGALPAGEVGMDQIMGLMTNR